jgi:hypothetical protein
MIVHCHHLLCCSKIKIEGNGSFAPITFCATTKQKQKSTATLLQLYRRLLCYNKTKTKGNGSCRCLLRYNKMKIEVNDNFGVILLSPSLLQ